MERIIKEFIGFSGSHVYLMEDEHKKFIRKINNIERNYNKLVQLNNLNYNVPKIYKKSDIEWLKDCYSLLSNNTIHKKAIVEDCDEHFDETEYKYFSHKYRFNQVLEVHKLCYNIIKDEAKIKLKYSDFINSSGKKSIYLLNYVNYGLIEKYTTQEFIWNMQKLATNKKLRDLLLNPLKNKENKTRLLKLFKQFKVKSDRKGPSISATFFKNNTYLIGNDNNLWKIKHKQK